MTPEAWNMSETAFNAQHLTGHGIALLRHMGEYVARKQARTLVGPDTCRFPHALFAADDSFRDVQSAQAFMSGFFPPECAESRSQTILVANSTYEGLHAAVTDDFETLCGGGPDEQHAEYLFGTTEALTRRYKPQFDKISSVLGCCSAELCARYGVTSGARCTIDELKYSFTGTFYQGLYTGPLQAAATFAQAWMLQSLSGVSDVAWGMLTDQEVLELYEVHMRLMWLGSNLNRSKSVGSHLLAFVVASLEQVIQGKPLKGAAPTGVDSSPPSFVALFSHDFNLLYLRKLLRASWLTEAWLFDVAATGASISFELYEAEGNGDAEAGTRASTVYRVRGVLTAASPEQQSSAVPLVPPEEPPGRSVFLDETFDAFKAAALSTIELRCVLPPLRETAFALQKGSGSGGSGWAELFRSGESIAVGALFLLAGCAFGCLGGRAAKGARRGNAIDASSASEVRPVLDVAPPDQTLLGRSNPPRQQEEALLTPPDVAATES